MRREIFESTLFVRLKFLTASSFDIFRHPHVRKGRRSVVVEKVSTPRDNKKHTLTLLVHWLWLRLSESELRNESLLFPYKAMCLIYSGYETVFFVVFCTGV